MRKIFLFFSLAVLLSPSFLMAGRSVDVAVIETGDGLDDNAGESHTFKCVFLNPSPNPQNVTLTYWSKPNTTNSKTTLPAAGVTIPSFTLNTNESYSALFCLAKSALDCEEPSINAIPIRLNISITNNDGWLIGNCVTHFSDNANKHRASSVAIAGGRPF